VIDGLVMTFVNIGQLRQAERAREQARAYSESIVDTVREPLVVLSQQLRVISANKSFYRTFRTTAMHTEGELIYELGMGQWNISKLRTLLEEILPKNTKFEDYEVEVTLPKLGRRVFALNARRLEQPEGGGNLILLAMEDMTSK
jgi:two-component system CheB/CheR fusion protein